MNDIDKLGQNIRRIDSERMAQVSTRVDSSQAAESSEPAGVNKQRNESFEGIPV